LSHSRLAISLKDGKVEGLAEFLVTQQIYAHIIEQQFKHLEAVV
jgi:hypothetical protein